MGVRNKILFVLLTMSFSTSLAAQSQSESRPGAETPWRHFSPRDFENSGAFGETLAVSPDGNSVAQIETLTSGSGKRSCAIKVFNFQSKKLIGMLEGLPGSVGNIKFSPKQNSLFFSAHEYDTTKRMLTMVLYNWDMHSARAVRGPVIYDLSAISPNGNTFIDIKSSYPVASLFTFSPSSEHQIAFSDNTKTPIGLWATSADFSPDGKKVAVGTYHYIIKDGHQKFGSVKIIDVDKAAIVGEIAAAQPQPNKDDLYVSKVKYSPDGKLIAVCRPLLAEVWDCGSGKKLWSQVIETVTGDVCFSPDSKTLAINGRWNDKPDWKGKWFAGTQLRNSANGTLKKTIDYPGNNAHLLWANTDGFMAVQSNNSISLINTSTGKKIKEQSFDSSDDMILPRPIGPAGKH